MFLIGVAVIVLASLSSVPATAQEPEGRNDGPEATLVVPKVEEGPVLDGLLEDPAWEGALRLDPVMHVPDYGAEPSEATEFLLAHDGEHLYFGCRAHDSDPGGIRAPSLRRNEGAFNNDWCVINLDPLRDGETTLVFGTTPAGLRTDVVFSNDGTPPPNFDWNTFWDVAVDRTEEGWSAVMRIPFSSLAFQARDGRVVMGVSVWRNIARKNERISYPGISPRWGLFSIFKASQMAQVTLEEVEARRAVHVTPYALGGGGHTHDLAPDGSAYLRATGGVREAGLDVQYGLGPSFTLDLSLNTDFAQVEADDQEVNLDRFSLFFPEKRRFFQERAAVFEFPLGGVERLFHSRRVGLAEGRPVRIYGGGRVVGRMGDWDLGLLNMHTAESEALPSENKGVVRVRRRVLNESSYVGGVLTSRIGTDGSYNVVWGGDALLRLLDQDYLTLNWAGSWDDADESVAGDGVGFPDRSLVRVRWERRGEDGFTYDLALSRAGEVFEPGLGFLFRRDYSRGDARVGYGWRPGEGSQLLRYGAELETSVFRRNRDGVVETALVQPSAVIETRRGHQLTGTLAVRQENLDEPFRLSDDVSVPEGRHRFVEGTLVYRPPLGDLFQPSVTLEGGRFFDGHRRSVQVSPSWSPSRHLGLRATYRIDDVRFTERDERFTAHVGRVRVEVFASTTLSVAAFVQYNSELDLATANVRFRYNPREGNDLYIVWNEGVNVDRLDHDPVRPRVEDRTLLIKYSRTFSFEL